MNNHKENYLISKYLDVKRKLSTIGSLKLLNNCTGVPPFLSPVLVLYVFVHAYMHAHIYTYTNQKITQWGGHSAVMTCYLCPAWVRAAGGRVSPATRELEWRPRQLWEHGKTIGGGQKNEPFLCIWWHIPDPRPHLNMTLSLLFILAHNKLLPSLKSCIYKHFYGGNPLSPFSSKGN